MPDQWPVIAVGNLTAEWLCMSYPLIHCPTQHFLDMSPVSLPINSETQQKASKRFILHDIDAFYFINRYVIEKICRIAGPPWQLLEQAPRLGLLQRGAHRPVPAGQLTTKTTSGTLMSAACWAKIIKECTQNLVRKLAPIGV